MRADLGGNEPSERDPMVRAVMLLLVLGFTPLVDAGWVWTKKTGWYSTSAAVQSSAKELLEQADKAFAEEAYLDAVTGFERLRRVYPGSPEALQAQARLFEAQYRSEDFPGAMANIEGVLRRQPRPSPQVMAQAIQRKYDIGTRYLNGAPRFVFGIPVSGRNAGVQILQEVADRHPFQPCSDDALFYLAGNYFERERYEQSEAIYDRLLRVYPKSEWAGIAEYQIGEAALKRHKGVEYDFALVDKAERSFRRYLRRYPQGGKVEQAEKQLIAIDHRRGEKLLRIASFYLREKRPGAARYYLQRILKDHPEAPVVAEARALLRSPEAQDAK